MTNNKLSAASDPSNTDKRNDDAKGQPAFNEPATQPAEKPAVVTPAPKP